MSDEKLKEHLNFDEADLGANRLGQLTQKQKARLGEKFKSNRNLYLFIGIAIVVMFCGSFLTRLIGAVVGGTGRDLLGNGNNAPSLVSMLPFIAMAGVFLLVFGVILFFVLRVVFGKANQKADVAVQRAQGKVNFVWVEREERNMSKTGPMFRTVRSLELRVGENNTFNNVNAELPNLIDQGEEWIFYYTNHPFKLLSAEKAK